MTTNALFLSPPIPLLYFEIHCQPLKTLILSPSLFPSKKKKKKNDNVWAVTEQGCFLATIQSSSSAGYTIKLSDNLKVIEGMAETHLFPATSVANTIDPSQHDLTFYSALDTPTVLSHIQQRYQKNQIYTWMGEALIAVNPNKPLKIYQKDLAKSYQDSANQDPHIFAIAGLARRSLCRTKTNISIIISGESGSGKTVSCNKLIQSLVFMSNSPHAEGIETRLIAANPILEAFGNAKTVKNDNSSRYGKFHKIYLDELGSIVSASLETYLLEKTRVVFHSTAERTYHVFYQLCSGLGEETRKEMNLKSAQSYHYLRNSANEPSLNDAERFRTLEKCLAIVGIAPDLQKMIWVVLAGILEIGNLQFSQPANAKTGVANQSQLDIVSNFLQTDSKDLERALISRLFVSGSSRKSQYSLALSVSQANDSRDALAKYLYERLFSWVVNLLNFCLQGEGSIKGWVGILDIFGFESFQSNSFEQININYANEKLKQQWNNVAFKLDVQEYLDEGIPIDKVEYNDNSQTINFLEKKGGLISLLDEECLLPKGSDEKFVYKLLENFKTSSVVFPVKTQQNSFGIRHYAGDLVYNADSFLEKNKDPINPDLEKLVSESPNQFLSNLATQNFSASKTNGLSSSLSASGSSSGSLSTTNISLSTTNISSNSSSSTNVLSSSASSNSLRSAVGTTRNTLASQFRQQLINLTTTLNQTKPFYVSCLMPNRAQEPDHFDAPCVLTQIAANGLLDYIRIRKQGWFFRSLFSQFVAQYRALAPPVDMQSADKERRDSVENDNQAHKAGVEQILNLFSVGKDEWTLGRTKVFLSKEQFARLEKQLELVQKEREESVRRSLAQQILREKERLKLASVELRGIDTTSISTDPSKEESARLPPKAPPKPANMQTTKVMGAGRAQAQEPENGVFLVLSHSSDSVTSAPSPTSSHAMLSSSQGLLSSLQPVRPTQQSGSGERRPLVAMGAARIVATGDVVEPMTAKVSQVSLIKSDLNDENRSNSNKNNNTGNNKNNNNNTQDKNNNNNSQDNNNNINNIKAPHRSNSGNNSTLSASSGSSIGFKSINSSGSVEGMSLGAGQKNLGADVFPYLAEVRQALFSSQSSVHVMSLIKLMCSEALHLVQCTTQTLVKDAQPPEAVVRAHQTLPVDVRELVRIAKAMLIDPQSEQLSGLEILLNRISDSGAVLSGFLEQYRPVLDKRAKILLELLETERTYVAALYYVYSAYVTPLTEHSEMIGFDRLRLIFPPSLAVIKQINTTLLARLDDRLLTITPDTQIGDIFLEMGPFLRSYTDYVTHFNESRQCISEILSDDKKQNRPLQKFFEETSLNGPLKYSNFSSLMVQPVQRIPRYILLLEDLLKNTPPKHVDHQNVQKALSLMRDVAQHVNTDNTKTIIPKTAPAPEKPKILAQKVKASYTEIRDNIDDFYYRIFQTSSEYGGIQIGPHQWMNITFKNCFTGKEFVECVANHYVLDEREIKRLGSLLLKRKYISHLSSNLLPFTTACFYQKTGVAEKKRSEMTNTQRKRNATIIPNEK